MKLVSAGIVFVSVLAFGAASAQSSTSQSNGTMSGSMGHSMHRMGSSNGSMHTMPATVTSVDQKTGMVEVNSEGMDLKLHFPPASLASLKSGDKITLHLGFSKS